MAIACDNHEDRSASFVLTNLDNGDVLSMCGECVVPTLRMMLEAAEAMTTGEADDGDREDRELRADEDRKVSGRYTVIEPKTGLIAGIHTNILDAIKNCEEIHRFDLKQNAENRHWQVVGPLGTVVHDIPPQEADTDDDAAVEAVVTAPAGDDEAEGASDPAGE